MTAKKVPPQWDPELRNRVQSEIDKLVLTIRDIEMRYFDDDGYYTLPDPVPFGDVSGLIETARHQVIDRMQEALDRAKAAMRDAYLEIDAQKRRHYGPNYRPPPRTL